MRYGNKRHGKTKGSLLVICGWSSPGEFVLRQGMQPMKRTYASHIIAYIIHEFSLHKYQLTYNLALCVESGGHSFSSTKIFNLQKKIKTEPQNRTQDVYWKALHDIRTGTKKALPGNMALWTAWWCKQGWCLDKGGGYKEMCCTKKTASHCLQKQMSLTIFKDGEESTMTMFHVQKYNRRVL